MGKMQSFILNQKNVLKIVDTLYHLIICLKHDFSVLSSLERDLTKLRTDLSLELSYYRLKLEERSSVFFVCPNCTRILSLTLKDIERKESEKGIQYITKCQKCYAEIKTECRYLEYDLHTYFRITGLKTTITEHKEFIQKYIKKLRSLVEYINSLSLKVNEVKLSDVLEESIFEKY